MNTLRNIHNFKFVKNDKLLIIKTSFEVYLDECFLGRIEEAFYISEYRDYIILKEIYNNCAFIIKDNKVGDCLLNGEYSFSSIFENYAIITNAEDKDGIYDFAKGDILFISNGYLGEQIFKDCIIGRYYDKITCQYISNRNKNWQFSLSQFPNYLDIVGYEQEVRAEQIIGIYNSCLWVHLGLFRIIGLDISTGELVCHIEDMRDLLAIEGGDDRSYFSLATFGDPIHLDEEQGVLKGFAHRYCFEIDLEELTGKVICDFGESVKEGWRIKNSTFYKDEPNLLFFSGSYKCMSAPNAFGVFDTLVGKIVWYETRQEDMGWFPFPPQANKNLLGILDDQQNLLIYER